MTAVGKATDPRWPACARRLGLPLEEPVQWEMEALDPGALHHRVLDVVDRCTDRAVLTAVLAEERRQRRELDALRCIWRERHP
nr:hypothetical protein [Streptomyces sp. CBMA152]